MIAAGDYVNFDGLGVIRRRVARVSAGVADARVRNHERRDDFAIASVDEDRADSVSLFGYNLLKKGSKIHEMPFLPFFTPLWS